MDEQMLKDRGRPEDARQAYIAQISDAWRGPGSELAPAPRTGESPRDAYIRRTSTAYKLLPDLSPPDDNDRGDDDPRAAANAIEAQRRRWTAESPAKDAALSDRDAAYGEYLDYIQNAYKKPYGVGVHVGGRR